MAHEFQSGFFVNTPAWHNLGKVIQQAPTVKDGIILAGLDWQVSTKDLFLEDKRTVSHKAVLRNDNNKILGVVGPNWTPFQNEESFSFFNDFLETNEVSLETAGSLREGKTVWVLAKIKNAIGEVVKNDPIERYFLLSNGHDGKRSVSLGFTDTRVVCQNTLNLADTSESSKLIRVIHSKKVHKNVDEIKSIIDMTSKRFIADLEKLKALTNKGINQKDVEMFVDKVFFKFGQEKSTRAQNKYESTLEKINELLEIGAGSNIKGVRGTKYGLYQATTEYLTHHIYENDEKRLNQLWFGTNKQISSSALNILLEA